MAVQLDEDSKQIDEIVVIGYGTQKRYLLPGRLFH